MTAKKKPKPTVRIKGKTPMAVKGTPADVSKVEKLTRNSLRPTVQAGLSLMTINKAFGEMDINVLIGDLRQQCEAVNGGKLSGAESMLVAQAYTLDALFNSLVRRAEQSEFLNQTEVRLRLAMKAQAQCRTTWEALAGIKNPPPVAFVRQANIAHGPQQVNNGMSLDQSGSSLRSENSGNQPNKVLDHQHGERLEFGAAGQASSADSSLEAVGSVNRP